MAALILPNRYSEASGRQSGIWPYVHVRRGGNARRSNCSGDGSGRCSGDHARLRGLGFAGRLLRNRRHGRSWRRRERGDKRKRAGQTGRRVGRERLIAMIVLDKARSELVLLLLEELRSARRPHCLSAPEFLFRSWPDMVLHAAAQDHPRRHGRVLCLGRAARQPRA
jgi:hypothetical protein